MLYVYIVYSIHCPQKLLSFWIFGAQIRLLIDINMKIFPKFEPLVCFYDMIYSGACHACRFGFESNLFSLRLEEF